MYIVSTSDIEADLRRHPPLVRAAVQSLLDAARADPWTWGSPAGTDPASPLRFHHFIAAGHRVDLFIMVTARRRRIDAVRLHLHGDRDR